MPRVFITNDTGLDYTKAGHFGPLVSLTMGSLDIFRPERVQQQIVAGLKNFNPVEDYLLPAGAAIAAGFALAYLAAESPMENPTVQLLLFDSKKRDYIVRTVEI